MLVIQTEQDPTPSFPIKSIPFTSIQDLSCSGPKLAQLAPPKQNPNPPPIHLFQHLLKFHMADVRDAEEKFKPGLFEALILCQPSSPLIAFEQYILSEFEDKFFPTRGERWRSGGHPSLAECLDYSQALETSLDNQTHHAAGLDCT